MRVEIEKEDVNLIKGVVDRYGYDITVDEFVGVQLTKRDTGKKKYCEVIVVSGEVGISTVSGDWDFRQSNDYLAQFQECMKFIEEIEYAIEGDNM